MGLKRSFDVGQKTQKGDMDELEKEAQKAEEKIAGGYENIYPSGWKWWRYRYEYSYVEEIILVIITPIVCVISLLMAKAYDWMAQRWREADKEFHSIGGGNDLLYRRWWNYCMSTIACVVFSTIALWLLLRLHVFKGVPVIVREYSPELDNLPTELRSYVQQGQDVLVLGLIESLEILIAGGARIIEESLRSTPKRKFLIFIILQKPPKVHLTIAVILYYTIILSVVRAAELKINRWQNLEEKHDLSAENVSPRSFRDKVAHVAVIDMAGDEKEFAVWRNAFIKKLSDPKSAFKGGKGQDLSHISFWRYLALVVQEQVTNYLCRINPVMWLMIAGTFFCFALLHRFYRTPSVYLAAGIVAAVFVVLGGMLGKIVDMKNNFVKAQSTKNTTTDSAADSNLDWFMTMFLQYGIFMLCYMSARIVASTFIWELYPKVAMGIVAGFILFYVLFLCGVAGIIATFGALMSLPPYLTPRKAAHLSHLLEAQGGKTFMDVSMKLTPRSPRKMEPRLL